MIVAFPGLFSYFFCLGIVRLFSPGFCGFGSPLLNDRLDERAVKPKLKKNKKTNKKKQQKKKNNNNKTDTF